MPKRKPKPEAVAVRVTAPFSGPDAPGGAKAGDELLVSPDRAAFLCDTYRVATRT